VTRGKRLQRLDRAEHVARKLPEAMSPGEIKAWELWVGAGSFLTSDELERLRDLLAGLVAAKGDPPLGMFVGERPAPLARTSELEAEYVALLRTAQERKARGEKPTDDEQRRRSRAWWKPRVKRNGEGYDVAIGAQSVRMGFDPTDERRAALALDLLPHLEAEAKEREREAGRRFGKGSPKTDDPIEDAGRSDEKAADLVVPVPTPEPGPITGPARPEQPQEPAPPGRAWRRQGDRPDELRDRIERWAF
jgi:hypothetical protein